MIKILFVCHGNICRSPMAEFVMKDIVKKAGRGDDFVIESAATSTEEIGSDIHFSTREILKAHNIGFSPRCARRIVGGDYDRFDYLIGMDEENLRNMKRVFNGDPKGKIYKLTYFSGVNRDVADPWYTHNFDITYDDIIKGCTALANMLL